jgi:hypothetical protein
MQVLLKKGFVSIPLLIAIILAVPILGVGSYFGVNYLQAKSLVSEADSLVKVEKYDQAIEKYALAQAKWSPKSLKDEENKDLDNAQKLKVEKDNYDNGINLFNDSKWVNAKDALSKIPDGSKYYQDAQSKLSSINDELDKEQQAKDKADQEAKQKAQVKSASVVVAQPTSNPNKDSLCRNEAELYKIDEKNKAIEELKSSKPELFWNSGDWLAHGYSQADLPYIIPTWQKNYTTAMAILDNAVQQIYLQKYNECLNK